MPWIETKVDEEFRQWVIDFPQQQLSQIYQLLERYKKDKEIIIFKSRQEANVYIKNLNHNK